MPDFSEEFASLKRSISNEWHWECGKDRFRQLDEMERMLERICLHIGIPPERDMVQSARK